LATVVTQGGVFGLQTREKKITPQARKKGRDVASQAATFKRAGKTPFESANLQKTHRPTKKTERRLIAAPEKGGTQRQLFLQSGEMQKGKFQRPGGSPLDACGKKHLSTSLTADRDVKKKPRIRPGKQDPEFGGPGGGASSNCWARPKGDFFRQGGGLKVSRKKSRKAFFFFGRTQRGRLPF